MLLKIVVSLQLLYHILNKTLSFCMYNTIFANIILPFNKYPSTITSPSTIILYMENVILSFGISLVVRSVYREA